MQAHMGEERNEWMNRMREALKKKWEQLTRQLKSSICILPLLIYGTDTWYLTKELKRKLRSVQRIEGKNALGYLERYEARNLNVRTKKGWRCFTTPFKKLTWAINIVPATDNRRTKRVTKLTSKNCKGCLGRQRIINWRDETGTFTEARWSTLDLWPAADY